MNESKTLHDWDSDWTGVPHSLRLVGLPQPSMVSAETEAQRERRTWAVIKLKHDLGNIRLAKDLELITSADAFTRKGRAYARYWRTIDHG